MVVSGAPIFSKAIQHQHLNDDGVNKIKQFFGIR